jgi:hypothetical protein
MALRFSPSAIERQVRAKPSDTRISAHVRICAPMRNPARCCRGVPLACCPDKRASRTAAVALRVSGSQAGSHCVPHGTLQWPRNPHSCGRTRFATARSATVSHSGNDDGVDRAHGHADRSGRTSRATRELADRARRMAYGEEFQRHVSRATHDLQRGSARTGVR